MKIRIINDTMVKGQPLSAGPDIIEMEREIALILIGAMKAEEVIEDVAVEEEILPQYLTPESIINATVVTIAADIEFITDPELLTALIVAEISGKNRKTAIDILNDRLAIIGA